MANNPFDHPDPLTLLPMVTLLPRLGSVNDLESFRNSLYARREKVISLKASLEEDSTKESFQAVNDEELMLKEALDWVKQNFV